MLLSEKENKPMLKEGSQAPDFTLPTVDDQSLSLSEMWQQGYHVLLIFLRHLA
jgi:peroxiredoxin